MCIPKAGYSVPKCISACSDFCTHLFQTNTVLIHTISIATPVLAQLKLVRKIDVIPNQ